MNVDDFLSLSELLVGIPSPVLPSGSVLDPKLAQVYMDQLCTWSVQGPFMEQLLATWNEIKDQPPDLRNASVNALIMNDPNLGPLARQIILAWYNGFHPWSDGQQPTPDPANYSQALVWIVAYAHPMAVPLRFDYWHTVPPGAR
ncbi:MAG TPA: sugar dehydrogenase complex small subunit [Vicinamibacterales bacterium]|nr:sugar dehydrogenase complex small subunit [Vicinamibacterales bacterium]